MTKDQKLTFAAAIVLGITAAAGAIYVTKDQNIPTICGSVTITAAATIVISVISVVSIRIHEIGHWALLIYHLKRSSPRNCSVWITWGKTHCNNQHCFTEQELKTSLYTEVVAELISTILMILLRVWIPIPSEYKISATTLLIIRLLGSILINLCSGLPNSDGAKIRDLGLLTDDATPKKNERDLISVDTSPSNPSDPAGNQLQPT